MSRNSDVVAFASGTLLGAITSSLKQTQAELQHHA